MSHKTIYICERSEKSGVGGDFDARDVVALFLTERSGAIAHEVGRVAVRVFSRPNDEPATAGVWGAHLAIPISNNLPRVQRSTCRYPSMRVVSVRGPNLTIK